MDGWTGDDWTIAILATIATLATFGWLLTWFALEEWRRAFRSVHLQLQLIRALTTTPPTGSVTVYDQDAE